MARLSRFWRGVPEECGLHDTFVAASAMAGMPANARYVRTVNARVTMGFPCAIRLINRRHAAESRRLLPVRPASGLPGAARTLARKLRWPRTQGQHPAGAGG